MRTITFRISTRTLLQALVFALVMYQVRGSLLTGQWGLSMRHYLLIVCNPHGT